MSSEVILIKQYLKHKTITIFPICLLHYIYYLFFNIFTNDFNTFIMNNFSIDNFYNISLHIFFFVFCTKILLFVYLSMSIYFRVKIRHNVIIN